MPFTAQSLVNQVRVLIPGLTESEVLAYVNRAYKWLLHEADIKTEPLSIAAVANTQGYDLSADLLKIDRVLWVTELDDNSRYVGTELKKIDGDYTGYFANVSSGTPTSYFLYNSANATAATTDSEAQIWTDIVYNGTPSGGYPKIIIYGTVYRALTLSDSLSNAVQFEDAVLSRVKHLAFLDYKPETADFWEMDSRKKLNETLSSLSRRVDGEEPTALPSFISRRRTAR